MRARSVMHPARTFRVLAFLVLAAAFGAPAVAEPRTVDLESESARQWFTDAWYGLFKGEYRVGWMRRSLRRDTIDDVPVVVREVETFLDIAGEGNTAKGLDRTVFRAEGTQSLVRIERRTRQQGQVFHRTVTAGEGRFDVVTIDHSTRRTGAVAPVDLRLADELALERLVHLAASREGGPAGARVQSRGLDLTNLVGVRRVFEVTDEIPAAEEGSPPRYRVRVGNGRSRWGEPVIVDASGRLVEGGFRAGMVVRAMREEPARASVGRTSVEAASRVRLIGKVGDPAGIRRITYAVKGVPAEFFARTPRQEVTEQEDGSVRLTVSRDADDGPVMSDDVVRSRKPSRNVDFQHPLIRRAVNHELRGTSRRAVQVRRLLDFTAGRLDDLIVLDEHPASRIMESRRGDCTEHTRLFVALCRAAGIPARRVRGVLWMGEGSGSMGWHAWAQVGLDNRWRPADALQAEMPASALRVQVADDVTDVTALHGATFEIVSVERD